MNDHPLLKILNEQQRAAVSTKDGPVLVVAGPGSGKTRVLTHRIAWMLSEMQVPPWQILAVTFTNKAAREMRLRLDRMLGDTSTRAMALGTFHSICARILRQEAEFAGLSPSYSIFDSEDQRVVMKRVVKELGLDEKRYRPRALLNAVSSAKNELITPTSYPVRTYFDEIVARAYARYQETLRKNEGLDFDDLLMETAMLLRNNTAVLEKYRNRYHYLLVDEFQDTNMAQYLMLRKLTSERRNLYVVADEDQSIYSWRGADYRNIQRLREDYPALKEYLLEENYRSTQVILDAAQAVIARNPDRTPKHLYTRKKQGVRVMLREAYDEKAEAEFVIKEIRSLLKTTYKHSDLAIMYRTNAQSRAIEESLIRYNIPYRLIGATRFYARREIKDLLAVLRLVQNSDDDVSLRRVINVPPRGIGAKTLDTVAAKAMQLDCSYHRALLTLLKEGQLAARAQKALLAFATMLEQWQNLREKASIAQLIDRILADIRYEAHLNDGTDEGESRWENVLALRAVVADATKMSLLDFLTEVALVADVDELAEDVDAVTLLTLHSAKGLEYPVVFLTGLEEGMLPHSRSMDSPQDIAEERRLLYVGMTRAEERLILSYAFRRGWGYHGSNEPSAPSRFLEDIPDEVLQRPRRAKKQTPRASWSVSTWSKSSSPARSREPKPIPQPQFRAGQRVKHRRYGAGTVMESEFEGRDEMVTVLFAEGIGVKRLLAGVAPLEPLPEH